MYGQPNPVIVQIRRELRGKLPDEWVDEIISILEVQLTYQTIDELSTNDMLRLRVGSGFSQTLNTVLTQAINPTNPLTNPSQPPSSPPPQPPPMGWRLPWQ